MRITTILAVLSFLSIGNQAFAGELRSANLKSEDGAEISVNYTVASFEPVSGERDILHFAEPVLIDLKKAGLAENAKVQVVLLNYVRYPATANSPERQEVFHYRLILKPTSEGGVFRGDLKADGGLLQGQPPESWYGVVGNRMPLVYQNYYHALAYTEGSELAVVVNGTWLKDPVSKSHNFKFLFTRD